LNILTKISVVVLVVWVLFSSAVFITYVRGSESWKQQYENMKSAKEVADVEAVNQMVHASAAIAQRQHDMETAGTAMAAVRDENSKLKADLADAKTANSSLGNNLNGIQTRLLALESNLKTEIELRTSLEASLKATNAKLLEAQRDLTLSQDQGRQKDAQIDRLGAESKILKTEIANLKEQIDKQLAQIESMSKGGAPAAAVSAATPAAAVTTTQKITGKVTAVQGEVVSINVGSAKGVKEGMILMIHRDGKLVGNLRISDVEVEQSAGVVEDKMLNPQQGDKVLSD